MKNINFYDEHTNKAAKRNSLMRERISIREIDKFIHSDEPKLNFIDVGCGEGTFVSLLSDKYKEKLTLYGIDYSQHQLDFAKSNVTDAIFETANFDDRLPFPDNYFDIVYSGEVIEHIYDPDFFISEIFRIMKNNGLFVLSTPNLCDWVSRVLFLFGIYPTHYETSTKDARYGFGFIRSFKKQSIPVGHIRVMNLDAVKSVLRNEGFAVIKLYGTICDNYNGFTNLLDKIMSHVIWLSSGFVVTSKKIQADSGNTKILQGDKSYGTHVQ